MANCQVFCVLLFGYSFSIFWQTKLTEYTFVIIYHHCNGLLTCSFIQLIAPFVLILCSSGGHRLRFPVNNSCVLNVNAIRSVNTSAALASARKPTRGLEPSNIYLFDRERYKVRQQLNVRAHRGDSGLAERNLDHLRRTNRFLAHLMHGLTKY